MRRPGWPCAFGLVVACALPAMGAGPMPIGEADVTFSYMTDSGLRVLNSSVDYSGRNSGDVIPLGGDPNLGYFNSVNVFGRRILINGAIREGESFLTHALFKPPAHVTDFFQDIVENGSVTLEVQGIHLTEPAIIQQDTVMVHKMWDADQVDWLYYFYINVHNHDTGTDPFRDFDDFFPLVFMNLPSSNYDLGVLTGPRGIEVFGDGTDTLGFRITIPYANLRHFEDVDQQVPVGLPAPFGFLEPFHFHVEFVVAAVRADSDQDGDVDLDDFAAFLDCLAVSSGSQEPDLRGGATQCMFADTDGNGELDLCDFAGFQRAFTGSHK